MKLLAGQFMYPRPCPAKKNPAAHTSMPTSNGSVFISSPFDLQLEKAALAND
jgi:hypothetical protein